SILNNDSYDDVLEALEKTLQDVLEANEVPACNEVQCRWAANHRLEGAQKIAKDMLDKRDEWQQVFAEREDGDDSRLGTNTGIVASRQPYTGAVLCARESW